jgi:hypothetical protein
MIPVTVPGSSEGHVDRGLLAIEKRQRTTSMRHRRVGRTGPNIPAICDLVRRCSAFGGLFLILLAVAPFHYQGQVSQDRLAGASGTQSGAGAECDRPISVKQLPSNILHDQNPIWLFPVQVAKGKHLKPVVAVTLATAGLVALDPGVGGYFRNSPRYANWPNGFFSGLNMALATAIPPAAVYAVGLARKDSYA